MSRGGLLRGALVLAPVTVFMAVVAVFYFGLGRENPQELPSAFLAEPAPPVDLSPLLPGEPGLDAAALNAPGVKLVNVWASWCVPCRVEHADLMKLADEGVAIYGFNYKDAPADARAFLAELGDPYARIGTDKSGRAGIEWGVYGVPETFVIDGEGTIVYKHVGPIQNDDLEEDIRPAIAAARAGTSG